MKKLLTLLLIFTLLTAAALPALAADIPVVAYNGGATLVYSLTDGTFGTAFRTMVPGVTSTQVILLQNNSADTVRFYMSLQVLKTLLNQYNQTDGAAYTVLLSCGAQTLFSSAPGNISGSLIGGQGTGELAELDNALYSADRNGILVTELAPDGSQTLSLSITPNATLSDIYQDSDGALQFQFFAEKNKGPETVYIPGKVVTKYVATGENTLIYVAAGVMLCAAAVLLLTGRKKKEKEERV